MLTPSMPGGNVTGCVGSGGPIGLSKHAEHTTKTGDGGLRLVEHLGELGDRLEEPVRQEDEPDERAGGQTAVRDRVCTPTLTTAATVSTLNTSPDGNRYAPIVLARMNAFDRSWLERFVTWA